MDAMDVEIKALENGLFVSRCGRVFKEAQYNYRGNRKVRYKFISWRKKKIDVHRLIASTFLPRIPGKDWVLHYDDNPLNNRIENLRWGNPKENSADAIRNGRIRKNGKPRWYPNKARDALIFSYYQLGERPKKLAEKFNLSIGRIVQIVNYMTSHRPKP
jgi:hypothetical protein